MDHAASRGAAQEDRRIAAILDALPDPLLFVRVDAHIDFANRAALLCLGEAAGASANLAARCPDAGAAAAFLTYLRRCSGSVGLLPGAVTLRDRDGRPVRFQCRAGLHEPAGATVGARLLLRLSDAGHERFRLLTRQIDALNAEVRQRRRAQERLEEALRERELLLRELHHRVKNNIQMLRSMLSTAMRGRDASDPARILQEAARRLSAVGAVHQMLYVGDLEGVPGGEFLDRVGRAVLQGLGMPGGLVTEAEQLAVSNEAAVPLGLILNELIANAAKHGRRADGTPGTLRAGLRALPDGMLELWVEDEGPGFDRVPEDARGASGLSLVRGLARQVGGAFLVSRGEAGGARCAVRFPPGDARPAAKEHG